MVTVLLLNEGYRTRLTGLLDPQYYLTMKQTYQLLLICAVAFIPDLTSTFGGIESVIVTL